MCATVSMKRKTPSYLFAMWIPLVSLLFLTKGLTYTSSFVVTSASRGHGRRGQRQIEAVKHNGASEKVVSRRTVFQTTFLTGALAGSRPAWAAQRQTLDATLYRILRVREATQQESRLIKNGKFKDVQRANIKLAVRFMVQNYRLSDAFVAASTYLDGDNRRLAASQVGQSAVQNLYTILEYYDSSDVENLKVLYGYFVSHLLLFYTPVSQPVLPSRSSTGWSDEHGRKRRYCA